MPHTHRRASESARALLPTVHMLIQREAAEQANNVKILKHKFWISIRLMSVNESRGKRAPFKGFTLCGSVCVCAMHAMHIMMDMVTSEVSDDDEMTMIMMEMMMIGYDL